MPKTPEQLETMFSDLSTQFSTAKKDFELKLESANKTATEFKELAQKREEELRKFKQEEATREEDRKVKAAAAYKAEIQEFIEAQVKAGRILPAFKEKFTAFMTSLTSESNVMEFKESDGSKRSHTQISLFKELITKMKSVVPVNSEMTDAGEMGADTPDGTEKPVEQYAEVHDKGQLKKLPIAGVELAAKAYEYIEAQGKIGKKVSYEEALIFIEKKMRATKAKV